jgi:hypothetical protein
MTRLLRILFNGLNLLKPGSLASSTTFERVFALNESMNILHILSIKMNVSDTLIIGVVFVEDTVNVSIIGILGTTLKLSSMILRIDII